MSRNSVFMDEESWPSESESPGLKDIMLSMMDLSEKLVSTHILDLLDFHWPICPPILHFILLIAPAAAVTALYHITMLSHLTPNIVYSMCVTCVGIRCDASPGHRDGPSRKVL